jgi:RNA polymerase sigma-70 factor (ECF subfamily)
MDQHVWMRHVTQAVAGDADALQRLLIEYHESLCAKVRARLGAPMGRHVDPDDIVQEAYARAFRAIPGCSFESARAFQAWLEEITLNVLRDRHRFHGRMKRDLRRDARELSRMSESYEKLVERVAATDSTPSRKIAKAEASAAVLSSLARLTEDQRGVVELRFLKGWAVADVAEYLGKSEAAVHMLCHRGLKSLREVLLSMSRFLSAR